MPRLQVLSPEVNRNRQRPQTTATQPPASIVQERPRTRHACTSCASVPQRFVECELPISEPAFATTSGHVGQAALESNHIFQIDDPLWQTVVNKSHGGKVGKNPKSVLMLSWHWPKTLLCRNPRNPMSRRTLGGAKLWSKKATSSVIRSSSKNRSCKRSKRRSWLGAAKCTAA